MQSVVYKKIPRLDPALVERARRINVADLHEGLGPVIGRQCLMQPQMRALFPTARVCGQAITSFNFPGDNLMLHAAFRVAEAGDILVLTNGGSPQGALWGEIATYYSRIRKLGGAVIDGAARDTLQITEMAFPVFASHVSVSYPGKRGPGAVNVPVVVAGATVNPGDLIVGDADGVIVIPPAHVETTIRNAEARMVKEAEVKRRLDEGQTLYDVAGMKALFETAEIVEIDGIWSDR
ncbi:dimethylmenaquinone methyltransferase [Bradyrhizobium sp. AUGA SZCCT0222]|uniref:RraA family protein n=1 Tax=Bradyrhizobium sp. AUGA SZCCT0222 TaxID=2807668 RepID=UPI001BABE0B5|nr:dimethylmenaquinone methyltransferase [Bradyrhizobium sp. AUGA SZCCT0222]MBR1267085.1 dimethylmenaquinone methyltransferase [Bradyrhizobium sp. AUGA SZCCT0222]